jgi:hypothetical protein
VHGNGHAPIWNSGGRSDPSTDCNRLNLDLRQRGAAIGRRVNTRCQGEDSMRHQLAVFHVYDNFVLPHASLRQPLPVPEPPTARDQLGCGSRARQRWRPDSLTMCGRFVTCCSIASRRGSNLMPYKELVGAMSVRQGMSGVRAIS